jgi:hypothetical protein
VLPNDDAGRDDIFVMAHHLAHLDASDKRIRAWIEWWAPWYSQTEALIAKVLPKPLKWTADELAKRVGLNYATRTRLKITMIGATDCGKAKRALLRKKRAAARERARRAKTGAVPHATSAAQTEPWKSRGISRATYYRNLKNETAETNSCAAHLEQMVVDTKQSHDGAQRARPARAARPEFAVIRLHGAERFTINVPVAFRAMMDAARRAIVDAPVPKIGVFPTAAIAARIEEVQ